MDSIRQLSADEEAQRLAAANADQLRIWTGSLLMAGNLEELFGRPG